jgi:hypothetical protein
MWDVRRPGCMKRLSVPKTSFVRVWRRRSFSDSLGLRLPDRTVELSTGQLLVLDRCVPHDVEAEEDSAFLLTMSWHGQGSDTCETDEQK